MQTDELGGSLYAIVAPGIGQVADDEECKFLVLGRHEAGLQVLYVLVEIVAKGVEAGGIQDQHAVVFEVIGVDAMALAAAHQRECRGEEQYTLCKNPFHIPANI